MDSVYEHMKAYEGEEQALRFIHWAYSCLNLGVIVKFDRHLLTDLKDSVPIIGYRACVDELIGMTMESYPIEKLKSEVNESEYENIILDYEIWDRISDERKFFDIINRKPNEEQNETI